MGRRNNCTLDAIKSLCKGWGTQASRVHYKFRYEYHLWLQGKLSITGFKVFGLNSIKAQVIFFYMATNNSSVIGEGCATILSFSLNPNGGDVSVNKQFEI